MSNEPEAIKFCHPRRQMWLPRWEPSLKSLNNYFSRMFAYKSFINRFSMLMNYILWFSNHFSTSSYFPRFSGCRFFIIQVHQGPSSSGFQSRVVVQIHVYSRIGTEYGEMLLFAYLSHYCFSSQTKAYLEPSRTFTMKLFWKNVNGFRS